MKTYLNVILWTGAAGGLMAQNEPRTLEFQRIEAERVAIDKAARVTAEWISGQMVPGALVKGAPYSAEAVTETTQVLADGNRIVKRTSSKQYRDSEGRERREETSSMGAIFISDPVAKVSYTLHPETQTAEKSSPQLIVWQTRGDTADQTFQYSVHAPLAGAEPKVFFFNNFNGLGGESQARTDQLGTLTVEGVAAQGTRTTTLIPAGQIGNERPIEVVDERWYSPDLQMTVMTKHSDPREGETVYRLTNIQRIEQIRSLFEIPPSYAVKEPGGRGGGALVIRSPQK